MKLKFQIFSFLLSVMVFLSPLMAYANSMHATLFEVEEDCCVLESVETDNHSCCNIDFEETTKSCGDNSCHPNLCHINQVNVLPAFMPENFDEIKSHFGTSKKITIDNYKSLLISDVSSSSWKPPRFNS